MENHPIPQDVTGFKFRLIGSVTLKQFLYLLGAGGCILILYILPVPVFVKYPLMIIPAVISLCLAFVPIDGRPMDKMIMNFAKAVPAENEYIYRKVGVDMPFFTFNAPIHAQTAVQTDKRIAQKTVLFNQLSRSYFKPDKEEQEGLQAISALFDGKTPPQGFVNRVVKADEAPTLSKPAPIPTQEFESHEEKKEEAVLAKPHVPPTEPVSSPAAPVTAPAEVHTPPPAVAAAPVQTPTVATPTATQAPIQPVAANPAPVSIAPKASYEAANVIEGIVRDPRGKPLPHVIVEIIDANSVPQRTFRTNQNGMFISATPMPNGTYTIHLEDTLKKQEFEDKTVVVNGSILPVIEIASTDQREKLRRELFGGATS